VNKAPAPVNKAPAAKVIIKKVAIYSGGGWRESGWKNVYTPLTKGCVRSNAPTTVISIHGSKQYAYKEVCRVK